MWLTYYIEEKLLADNSRLVKIIERQKRAHVQQSNKLNEIRDNIDVLDRKCLELSKLIESAKHCIVYTGAGISTSADIPDYRGSGGVWTAISKGNQIQKCNLVTAVPTVGHMVLSALIKSGIIKYVISQNCDGLHIRSGISESNISEIHGNMYLENCNQGHKNYRLVWFTALSPHKYYFLRLFDVTEKTNVRRHKTGRNCPRCDEELFDSIVHFGELNHFSDPYRWIQADENVQNADLIVTIGTSLKVLKGYKNLWPKTAKLAIVNLQWTPKDRQSNLIVNGESDYVMNYLAEYFKIKPIADFQCGTDPLLTLAQPLRIDDVKPDTPVVDSVNFSPDFSGTRA